MIMRNVNKLSDCKPETKHTSKGLCIYIKSTTRKRDLSGMTPGLDGRKRRKASMFCRMLNSYREDTEWDDKLSPVSQPSNNSFSLSLIWDIT